MRISILIFAALTTLSAQPAFEVATIKPSGPQSRTVGMYTHPGGRVRGENLTLQILLHEAFDVQPFQIVGGPAWIREERYDLVAQPPASSKSSKSNPTSIKLPPNEEQRQMLKALLIERFQLKFHREEREGSVYFLVKTSRQLKLKATADTNAFPWVGSNEGGALMGDGIAGTNVTMAILAARLSRRLGRPVIDRTGIDGAYDFKIEYHTDNPQRDFIASILTSVQALGLKLESGKGPVETIVIDHAEKPSEN